jgi:dephospho-CoA kinase
MKVFIVNGAPGSGKTTFEVLVKREALKWNCLVEMYSTIDFVKDIAHMCGWDGTKTPENRKFLSDLKDLLTQWADVPYKKTLAIVEDIRYRWTVDGDGCDHNMIFIDCREPKEIKRLCESLNAKSILIRRDSSEQIDPSNHADKEVLNYNYDIVIDNNGTLNDLEKRAINFIKKDLA